ncbi:MAG: outer membrane beta-barrel protein [Porphyromonas sp.]|nr:outer membrane beta-barrel protein [Porphyromonas sp.]
MNHLIRQTVVGILLLSSTLHTFSQEVSSHWEINAEVGINIGASTPTPLPSSLKKVYTWYPKLNPSLGLSATYWLDRTKISACWGIHTGVYGEYKSVETTTAVDGMDIVVGKSHEALRGLFSGDNLASLRNGYVTIPVGLAFLLPKQKLTIEAGLYLSLLLQGSFTVIIDGTLRPKETPESPILIDLWKFDFSDQLRTIDSGWQGKLSYNINNRLMIQTAISMGFVSIVKRNFEAIPFGLHNVFATIGFSYNLSGL